MSFGKRHEVLTTHYSAPMAYNLRAARRMSSAILLMQHTDACSGVRSALEAQPFRIVAELADANALHTEVVRLAPDVIIVATRSPDAPLLAALERVAAACPRPVVVFSEDASRDAIRSAV